ncbi:Lipopolysaccharide biosynthesis protein WzxC [Jannaschia aquimarina]|uniref:WzxC protein n=2 Tax=Jannaschia aquimarina TaxID=935700 RepID=A0A0D1EKP3_9RHOB|nr:Lipopolysaccharide biosynthesis protein WzxC [Jannaschia aquimarina]SNT26524.1 polysaccharide transporter, PST family [Jannaschia aquimarina]
MLFARLVVRGSDFIVLLVLARLLRPEDFGLVTIAMAIVTILDVVTDLPLTTPLVRLDKVEDRHFNTAFTLGLLRGTVLFAIVALLAYPVAAFYDDPRLAPLLLVLGIGPAVRAMMSPKMSAFFKSLLFRQAFIMDVGGKSLGVVAAITFGLLTQSYWALAVSPLVTRVSAVSLSYWLAPYRPRLSLSEFRYFWAFLGWMFPAQFTVAIGWQFDRLFLGTFIPTATLGLYGVAANLTGIVEQSVRTSVNAPLVSSFVIAGKDRDRLRRGYTLADTAILTMGLLAYLLTAVFAEPFVALAFSSEWQAAAPFLQLLAIAMMPALVRIPFRALAMAAGRTDLVFFVAALALAIRVPAIAFGFAFAGIEGVIAGIGFGNLANAVIAMVFVRTLTGMSAAAQLRSMLRPVVATLVGAGIGWTILRLIVPSEGLALFGGLLFGTLAVSLAYLGTVFLLWRLAGSPAGIEKKAIGLVADRLRRR